MQRGYWRAPAHAPRRRPARALPPPACPLTGSSVCVFHHLARSEGDQRYQSNKRMWRQGAVPTPWAWFQSGGGGSARRSSGRRPLPADWSRDDSREGEAGGEAAEAAADRQRAAAAEAGGALARSVTAAAQCRRANLSFLAASRLASFSCAARSFSSCGTQGGEGGAAGRSARAGLLRRQRHRGGAGSGQRRHGTAQHGARQRRGRMQSINHSPAWPASP